MQDALEGRSAKFALAGFQGADGDAGSPYERRRVEETS